MEDIFRLKEGLRLTGSFSKELLCDESSKEMLDNLDEDDEYKRDMELQLQQQQQRILIQQELQQMQLEEHQQLMEAEKLQQNLFQQQLYERQQHQNLIMQQRAGGLIENTEIMKVTQEQLQPPPLGKFSQRNIVKRVESCMMNLLLEMVTFMSCGSVQNHFITTFTFFFDIILIAFLAAFSVVVFITLNMFKLFNYPSIKDNENISKIHSKLTEYLIK